MRQPQFLTGRTALVAGAISALAPAAWAADHLEAPGTQADAAADIDDVYAWHTSSGHLVAVITFGGPLAPGDAAPYDADTIYQVHIDSNGDNRPDKDITVRFGQASDGSWGVQVSDLPGGDAVVTGAVDTNIDAGGGLMVFAGVRDDPFFFDLTGFQSTLSTGTLGFDSSRDFFAGKNTTAIVLEMDTGAATGSSHTIQLWATTGRK